MTSEKLSDFLKREWELIHFEHFGEKFDRKYWYVKRIRIKAENKGDVVGGLSGRTMAGTFYVSELIVDHNKRGVGVGYKLMKSAENYARKNNIHIIYLETGKGWRAVAFYEKLGFKKETLIKNLFGKKDFWIMTKYL